MTRLPAVARRVGPTVGANVFGQLVVVGVQLGLVPVLLAAWGTERYGVWVLLSAIPNYLTLSDLGFTYIAKNEMTIRAARSDIAGALEVFQSILAALIAVVFGVGALLLAILFAADPGRLFALDDVSLRVARSVLVCLGGNVLLSQFFLLQCAGVRASGRPAAEVMWGATARLCEGVVCGAVAWRGGGLGVAALAILANRVLFTLLLGVWLRRAAPWIDWGFASASVAEVRRLLHPSLSYMFLSLSNALVIHGPVVILGAVADPAAVVVYSTTRTLSRLGTAATNLIGYSFTPEYSRLFAQGDDAGFRGLLKVQSALCAIGVAAYFIAMTAAGGWVMSRWTHGKVAIVYPFFGVMNASVALEMGWTTMLTALAAVNRHARSGYLYVVLSAAAFAACYGSAKYFGLTGAAIPFAVVNLIMLIQVPLELHRNKAAHASP